MWTYISDHGERNAPIAVLLARTVVEISRMTQIPNENPVRDTVFDSVMTDKMGQDKDIVNHDE